jgi:hypothetical protein
LWVSKAHQKGMSLEEISELTDLPVADLQEILGLEV